jgi:UDP-N-acetylmuramoylalanine--D-glutamate ligase
MIRCSAFQGKTVAVFGLGASGISAAEGLVAGGAQVAVWDDGEAGRAAAERAGLPLEDISRSDWSRFAALVLAPGVPLTHPQPHWTVLRARDAQVPIIGDIELFCRERSLHCPDAPFISITGTNGKSTTTALLAHLLRSLGHDVQMGGNIGCPVLTLEPPLANRFHVIEMSSFQIDLTPTLNPTVGVMLNVTPDHLDRHGSLDAYAAVKERLVQGAEAAVIGVDDPVTHAIAARLAGGGNVYPFAVGKCAPIVPRLYAVGSTLIVQKIEGANVSFHEVASLEGVRSLRGAHNVQNALAALTALRALQDRLDTRPSSERLVVWERDSFQSSLSSFPGLAHRMEEIGTLGRVVFINDSKATNADSTEKALSTWEEGLFWIVGGRPKDGGIAALESYFPRLEKAYLIGESATEFARTLEGKADFEIVGTLEAAVSATLRDAAKSSASEPVVLLSPACASYDQFQNFEIRGEEFRRLVSAIPGFTPLSVS